MNLTNSLVQVVCNATLQRYGGDLYVGVMTIINSLREVFTMPIQGLNNGAQPVIGYNYGAGCTAGCAAPSVSAYRSLCCIRRLSGLRPCCCRGC